MNEKIILIVFILLAILVYSDNISVDHFDIQSQDFVFDSETYILFLNSSFNHTGSNKIYFMGSAQTLKASGNPSTDLYMNISVDGVTYVDKKIRTISGIDDRGVFSIPIFEFNASTSQHNITIQVREDGLGSVNLSNFKLHILEQSNSGSDNISIVLNSDEALYNSQLYVNVLNFTVEKFANTSTYFDLTDKISINSGTSSNSPSCYLVNSITSEKTPEYYRFLSSTTDSGSTGITYKSNSNTTGNETWKLFCKSSDTDTINSSVTFFALPTTDDSGNIVASFGNSTNTSVSISGSSNKIISYSNHELLNSTHLEVTGSVYIQSTSAKQDNSDSPLIYINNTGNDGSCYKQFFRSLDSNNDIGAIKFYLSCSNLTLGSFQNITMYIDVASGETLDVLGATISGIESNEITVTDTPVPCIDNDGDGFNESIINGSCATLTTIDCDDTNSSYAPIEDGEALSLSRKLCLNEYNHPNGHDIGDNDVKIYMNNATLDGDGSNDGFFNNNYDGFEISGGTIQNYSILIKLWNPNNFEIKNVNFGAYDSIGIFMNAAKWGNITDNNFTERGSSGNIYMDTAFNYNISVLRNTFSASSTDFLNDQFGLTGDSEFSYNIISGGMKYKVSSAFNMNITGNNFTKTSSTASLLSLSNVSSSLITDNILNNTRILLTLYSQNNTIENNTLYNTTTSQSIYLEKFSDGNRICNNIINVTDKGVRLWNSSGNTICYNTIEKTVTADGNDDYDTGIILEFNSNGNLIEWNNLTDMGTQGIKFMLSNDTRIYNNSIHMMSLSDRTGWKGSDYWDPRGCIAGLILTKSWIGDSTEVNTDNYTNRLIGFRSSNATILDNTCTGENMEDLKLQGILDVIHDYDSSEYYKWNFSLPTYLLPFEEHFINVSVHQVYNWQGGDNFVDRNNTLFRNGYMGTYWTNYTLQDVKSTFTQTNTTQNMGLEWFSPSANQDYEVDLDELWILYPFTSGSVFPKTATTTTFESWYKVDWYTRGWIPIGNHNTGIDCNYGTTYGASDMANNAIVTMSGRNNILMANCIFNAQNNSIRTMTLDGGNTGFVENFTMIEGSLFIQDIDSWKLNNFNVSGLQNQVATFRTAHNNTLSNFSFACATPKLPQESIRVDGSQNNTLTDGNIGENCTDGMRFDDQTISPDYNNLTRLIFASKWGANNTDVSVELLNDGLQITEGSNNRFIDLQFYNWGHSTIYINNRGTSFSANDNLFQNIYIRDNTSTYDRGLNFDGYLGRASYNVVNNVTIINTTAPNQLNGDYNNYTNILIENVANSLRDLPTETGQGVALEVYCANCVSENNNYINITIVNSASYPFYILTNATNITVENLNISDSNKEAEVFFWNNVNSSITTVATFKDTITDNGIMRYRTRIDYPNVGVEFQIDESSEKYHMLNLSNGAIFRWLGDSEKNINLTNATIMTRPFTVFDCFNSSGDSPMPKILPGEAVTGFVNLPFQSGQNTTCIEYNSTEQPDVDAFSSINTHFDWSYNVVSKELRVTFYGSGNMTIGNLLSIANQYGYYAVVDNGTETYFNTIQNYTMTTPNQEYRFYQNHGFSGQSGSGQNGGSGGGSGSPPATTTTTSTTTTTTLADDDVPNIIIRTIEALRDLFKIESDSKIDTGLLSISENPDFIKTKPFFDMQRVIIVITILLTILIVVAGGLWLKKR